MEDIFYNIIDTPIPDGKIDEYLEKFSSSEILQLLSECEMILNGNESIISSLNVRGIEHFFNFITGKDLRNKRKLRINNQELHRVSLELHQSILNRLQHDEELLQRLILRENKWNLFFLDGLNKLVDKLEKTSIDSKLSLWCTTIKERGYNDLPLEAKVFNVIVDYCAICKYQKDDLDNRKYSVRTALNEISAKGEVNILEFFKTAINGSQDICLFEFNNCEKPNKIAVLNNMSIYGELLYDYPHFMIEAIKNTKIEDDTYLSDGFINYVSSKLDRDGKSLRINSAELCEFIIGDVILASSEIREEVEEQRRKELEIEERIKEEKRQKEEAEKRAQEERENAYIIKITPEGVWKISHNGKELLAKGEPGKKYVFSANLEEFISHNLKRWQPKAWVIGKKALNELSKKMVFPPSDTPVIYISDYYMKLWSIVNCKKTSTNKNVVVFIDYYDHMMYCNGYRLDNSLNYHSIFEDLMMNYNTFKNDIKNTIMPYAGVSKWDDLKVYRTFNVEAYLNKKLDHKKMQIHHVDENLEKVLSESVESVWEICETLIRS